jgi:hypothetical protein
MSAERRDGSIECAAYWRCSQPKGAEPAFKGEVSCPRLGRRVAGTLPIPQLSLLTTFLLDLAKKRIGIQWLLVLLRGPTALLPGVGLRRRGVQVMHRNVQRVLALRQMLLRGMLLWWSLFRCFIGHGYLHGDQATEMVRNDA